MSTQHIPRKHPRVVTELAVHWWPAGALTRRVSSTADMSAGGMCVLTATPAPAGTPLELRVSTDAGSVVAHGHVSWSDVQRGAMGVSFVDVQPQP